MTFEQFMRLLGVAIGLLLLGFSVYLYSESISFWRFSFCAAFGVLFAAFGSTGGFVTTAMSLTGAAAISYAIFNLTIPTDFQCVTGTITGSFPPGTSVYASDGSTNIPGGFLKGRSSDFRFVLTGEKLRDPVLTVEVKHPDPAPPIFFNIDRRYPEGHMSRVENFRWRIEGKKMIAYGSSEPIAEADESTQPPKSPATWNFHLISSAFAQESSSLSEAQLSDLAKQLQSSDYSIRRNARNSLIDAGIPAIRTVIEELRKAPNPAAAETFEHYFVLANIQRQNQNNLNAIKRVLNDDDFALLTQGIASPERQVRIHATEFLYGIADRRALSPSLAMLQDSTNGDAQWNATVVLQGFYNNLSGQEKSNMLEQLRSAPVGPKTKERINSAFR